MKIISGKYKGRNIEGYNIVGTRPTMDRVRESLFAMIQSHIKGNIILDLFAGTGALGLEALSEGAEFCYLNDHNPKCTSIIKKMQKRLEIQNIDIKTLDYQKALSYYQEKNIIFDLIFLDPPYLAHNCSNILKEIEEKNLIKPNGLIVCEYEKENINSPYPIYKEKKYGRKTITIYRNSKTN